MRKAPRFPNGFSLVEVVLAVGVISFALVVMVALFGGLMSRHSSVSERKELVAAVGALNTFLHQEVPFADLYARAAAGAHTNRFIQFRADADGAPDPAGQRLSSRWFQPGEPIPVAYDEAREGRWVAARIDLHTNNPAGSNLPASLSSYTDSRLVLAVELFPVPTPDFVIPPDERPTMTLPVVVLR